jgi:hypothetical protein
MTRSLAVLIAALAVAGVFAAPASATTFHQKWDYLTFSPSKSVADVPPRRLYLNGFYIWRVFVKHWAHQNERPYVARTVELHGTYDWYDTLRPWNGRYIHHSMIVNAATGGLLHESHEVVGRYGNGSYLWGSTIDVL